MSLVTSAWLSLFGILFYIYIVDPNVQDYFNLLLRYFRIKNINFWYSMKWNSKYPWARWWIRRVASRNAYKNARILAKELGIKE